MTRSPEIDAYIDAFDEPVRGRLRLLREAIAAEAPEATERMAYGLATWHQGENLVHIGGFAKHVGLYPGPEAIVAFAEALSGWPTSKGAAQFALDRPLPVDLVREITRYRVARAAAATAQKAAAKAAKRAKPAPAADGGAA
jgi:uncharacterized protein YdhG (YjbR/CyaY superfamily)